MPRITVVQHAKGNKPLACRRCKKEIRKGDSYKWFAKRYRGKFIYCANCPIRPSEMTSGRQAQLLEISENLDAAMQSAASIEDITLAIDDAISEIESLADDIEEGVRNIEDGFSHATSQSEEMQERADSIREWGNTLESAKNEIEDIDADGDDVIEQALEIACNAAGEAP